MLTGNNIELTYLFPILDLDNPYGTQFSQPIINVSDEPSFSPDANWTETGAFDVDFDAESFQVQFTRGGSNGWTKLGFNGFVFEDIDDSIPRIVGASIDPESIVGDIPDGIGFSVLEDGDALALNWVADKSVDSRYTPFSTFVVNLEFESEPEAPPFEFVVKPGEIDEITRINTASKGVTPFALLGGEGFDASQVDKTSIRVFDSEILEDPIINGVGINAKKKGLHYSIEDINGDGIDDFVFKVSTVEFSEKIESLGETELFVHGQYGNDEEGFEAFVVGGATADIF